MNDKLKCLFVFTAAFISTGYALSCYTCRSDVLLGCSEGSTLMKETDCGVDHTPLLQFCILKTVYDNVDKKEIVMAGCEVVRKPAARVNNQVMIAPEEIIVLDRNVAQCQSNQRYNVTHCDVCKTDLCNFASSAPVPKMSTSSFWYLFMFYLFTKFIFR